jgi:hypothetical protein
MSNSKAIAMDFALLILPMNLVASQDLFLPPTHPSTVEESSKPHGKWLTDDGEDTGLPLYWNWCEEGYCSEIKHQLGGSCLDNAKMAAIESRVHIHKYYNKSYPHGKKPPHCPTFSLMPYMRCKVDKSNRTDSDLDLRLSSDAEADVGFGSEDWTRQYGVYSEADWPLKGSSHVCSMAAHGNKHHGCSDTQCLIDEGLKWDGKACHKVWSQEIEQEAIDTKNPCLCGGETHKSWKAPGVMDQFHKDCKENLMKHSYDPCFCNVMTKKVKPLHTGDELHDMGILGSLNGPSKVDGPGNVSAAKARSIRTKGPAYHSIGSYYKYPISTDEDWQKLKKQCFSGDGHVVTTVGWNRLGPVPYWIIRNSYGAGWNDHGFIYVNMDC